MFGRKLFEKAFNNLPFQKFKLFLKSNHEDGHSTDIRNASAQIHHFYFTTLLDTVKYFCGNQMRDRIDSLSAIKATLIYEIVIDMTKAIHIKYYFNKPLLSEVAIV
jgi:hypothetical protein